MYIKLRRLSYNIEALKNKESQGTKLLGGYDETHGNLRVKMSERISQSTHARFKMYEGVDHYLWVQRRFGDYGVTTLLLQTCSKEIHS